MAHPPSPHRPANLTVNAGAAAYFTVTATNATTYQWTNALGKSPARPMPPWRLTTLAPTRPGFME